MSVTVKIEKLVHGGQGLARLEDGKTVFVWNALPGETVEVELGKSKKRYAEALATSIITASKDRIGNLEPGDIELSTQPWAIMDYSAELAAKKDILKETFAREGVELPDFEMKTAGKLDSYRSKVEFSFWGDDDGIFYAHYLRASHRKIKLPYPYNSLVFDQISAKAEQLLTELNKLNIRAGDLKSVIFRADSQPANSSKVVAALFVKTEKFPKLKLGDLEVYYSNPKSPASVPTKKLYQNGDTKLTDQLLGAQLEYDVLSFFQVNLQIFEQALKEIKSEIAGKESVDFYSGVGSIGVAVGSSVLVESDDSNIAMAKQNAKAGGSTVVHEASEKALDYIQNDKILIVDPPRGGLHKNFVARISEVRPWKVIYLSCNPATQARDVKLLAEAGYKIKNFTGYNFFPRTPHIESLAILEQADYTKS